MSDMMPPNEAPSVDYDEAEHFLETLIGAEWKTAPLVFQSFDDNRDRKRKNDQTARLVQRTRTDPYAKIWQGTWEEHKLHLTTMNANGAGVYLTINRTTGGRRVEHLQEIRAVWCEWDNDDPLPEWPIAPHILVESSRGKYHVYWLTANMTPPEHHRVMACLVDKWGSDPNAADAVRVLRLPGFFHRKVDTAKGLIGTPWLVKLVYAEMRDALPPYTTEQLLSAFGVAAWEAQQRPATPPSQIAKKSHHGVITPVNVVEVREAMRVLSAESRETWLKVGMALASTRHTAAFSLWDEWSRISEKYDEEDQYRVWQSFRENGAAPEIDHPLTLGTLYKAAKDAGWNREAGWQKGLLTNQQGTPVACPANIALILRHTPLWKETLKFNLFGGHVEYGEPSCDEYGRIVNIHRWTDVDDGKLADYLRSEHRMAVTNLAHCTQAVEQVAYDAAYDPIISWLDGLPPWDTIERLPSFFEDFCGVERSPYAEFCGISFFVSLVARAYRPGCQVDTVLVLQGAEGVRKTSLCRLLGGPWYKAITLSFESKDLFTSLRATWLGELAELDSFARSGQARIKSLLTTMSDSYRPPYARNEVDQLRRSVFVGTTNDPAYLVDPHGARRFLPLPVADINLDGVAFILPQLFAEARERYRQGESWWKGSPEAMAMAAEYREQVRESDPWEDLIERWVTQRLGAEIEANDLFASDCLDIPPERRSRSVRTRVGQVLHQLGYEKQRRRNALDWQKREYFYVKKS